MVLEASYQCFCDSNSSTRGHRGLTLVENLLASDDLVVVEINHAGHSFIHLYSRQPDQGKFKIRDPRSINLDLRVG